MRKSFKMLLAAILVASFVTGVQTRANAQGTELPPVTINCDSGSSGSCQTLITTWYYFADSMYGICSCSKTGDPSDTCTEFAVNLCNILYGPR